LIWLSIERWRQANTCKVERTPQASLLEDWRPVSSNGVSSVDGKTVSKQGPKKGSRLMGGEAGRRERNMWRTYLVRKQPRETWLIRSKPFTGKINRRGSAPSDSLVGGVMAHQGDDQ